MLQLRRSKDRGHANHGWLDTHHSFSFAGYHDSRHMGFRALRVINEDRVDPGAGFPTHPHRDMEILTYVLDGALEHRDSMGNGSIIRPGDVQIMSAGTGITHSEFNHSEDHTVHFLQIWVEPDRRGLKPNYQQVRLPAKEQQSALVPMAAKDGSGAVHINQDVTIHRVILTEGQSVTHQLSSDRHAWLQVAQGELTLNGQVLHGGDGAAVSDEPNLTMRTTQNVEAILFDLA